MRNNAKYLLTLACAVALMGQGCAAGVKTDVDTSAKPSTTMPSSDSSDGAAIDAAIDAEIDAALDIDAEERKGDSDVDVVENDKAELNSLNEMQYDLP